MALGRRLDIRTRNGGRMGAEGVPMTCPDSRRADQDCECEPIRRLAATQEPLGPEFEKVLHDNLWGLYECEPIRAWNAQADQFNQWPDLSGAERSAWLRAFKTPGHTDLMVAPESLDAWLDANPPPGWTNLAGDHEWMLAEYPPMMEDE